VVAKLHIGTSGWHYKHWVGVFYPPDLPTREMLAFYSRHFDTVELNNTFYHLPAWSSVDAWRENSPSGFCFAVKGSRYITHMKKLKDPHIATTKFFAAAERLESKMGPVLWQLPPRWKLDLNRLSEFLDYLPGEHRYIFEFRDESWLVPQVYGLLRKHNAGFCIHDLSDMKIPLEVTADFTYIRLHGPGSAKYSGSYSHEDLEQWASRIKGWKKTLSEIYVYFNNDIGGWAIKNAIELKRLTSRIA
jgi:uncharacterized protein YecE (DUF72 family)